MLIVAFLISQLFLQLSNSCTTQNDAALRQTTVSIDECKCREYLEVYASCAEQYFSTCERFPRAFQTHLRCFKLQITAIKNIVVGDFGNMTHLTSMYIDTNKYLVWIEAGAFKDMKNLINLSISYNPSLIKLEEHVFEGLDNLESLTLTRNGFNEFKDFSASLKAAYMPQLQTINLQELTCQNVDENDFINLNGSKIANVFLDQSQIKFIHPDALTPLKKLKKLSVGETLLTDTNLIDVLEKMTENGISLKSLNIEGWCFKQNISENLLNVIANTTVEELILNRNLFHVIDKDTFPKMPNIVNLALEQTLIADVKEDALLNFPGLKQLRLKQNKLMTVPKGVLLPTIELLDVSENSKLGTSYFSLGHENLINMSSLTVLNLSCNNLRKIYNNTFSGLVNLKILNLYESNVLFITDDSFIELAKLEHLNLGKNYFSLRTFQKSIFKGLSNLKYLSLEGCNINHIPSDDLFVYLISLETLDLRSNSFADVTPEFVVSIRTLKVLNVDGTGIKMWHRRLFKHSSMENFTASHNGFIQLTDAMLEDFSNFKMIDVSENPFYCTCEKLIEPFNSLNQSKAYHVLSILNQTNTNCLLPEVTVSTTIVSYYQNNYLDCKNRKVANLIRYLVPSVVCVILILSVVILSYIYRWHIRYWIFLTKVAISKRTQLNKRQNVRSHTKYLYDAFVSYSSEDRNFVIRLVSMLENYEPFLKLCVYERDFEIGTIISENVSECLSRSRKTLLIISNSYIKSQWCTWEAQVAENHRLFFENEYGEYVDDSLIMIKLGHISSNNVSPMLKYLMKTRIYLQWDPTDGKQEQFWEKLRNALAPASSCTQEKPVDVKI